MTLLLAALALVAPAAATSHGLWGPIELDDAIAPGELSHGAWFGRQVEIAGNLAAITAPRNDPPTVLLYEGTTQGWEHRAELVADASGVAEEIGAHAVAMGEDLVLVSHPGYKVDEFRDAGGVHLFEPGPAGGYEHAGTLTPPDADWYMGFGASLALDEDRLVVGAPTADRIWPWIDGNTPGAAYIFERTSGEWEPVTRLVHGPTNIDTRFGQVVAVAGETVAVTAVDLDGPVGNGLVLVYERDGAGTWSMTQELRSPEPRLYGAFAQDIALTEETLVVGAPRAPDAAGWGTGAVYVYTREAGAWTLNQKLLAQDGEYRDSFGEVVDITETHGGMILAGAPHWDSGEHSWECCASSGAAYLFQPNATTDRWDQTQQLVPETPTTVGIFGLSLALRDDAGALAGSPEFPWPGAGPGLADDAQPLPPAAIIGSPRARDLGTTGTAYVFQAPVDLIGDAPLPELPGGPLPP